MSRDELYYDLVGLANSFDNHVTKDDVVSALEYLINRLEIEGLEDGEL